MDWFKLRWFTPRSQRIWHVPSTAVKAIDWSFVPVEDDTASEPDPLGDVTQIIYLNARGHIKSIYNSTTQNQFIALVKDWEESGQSEERHPDMILFYPERDFVRHEDRRQATKVEDDIWE